MNESNALPKTRIISELARSPHGDLAAYIPVGARAVAEDSEFFAHLIAWNQIKGQIRDSKVALPVIGLAGEHRENSLAHLAKLDPRNLLRAVRFSRTTAPKGSRLGVRRLVERYLRARESKWPWWERSALQHRKSMKELYALHHIKPAAMANAILFENNYPAGTAFDAVKRLPSMGESEAAAAIAEHRIPFLVVSGALGTKAKAEPLLFAMLERMTPAEVVTNAATLEKFGVKSTPALRGAFEAALGRVAESKVVTLKTTKAAEAVTDQKVSERLRGVQEKQINTLGGIDGDWLVLADKSGSMQEAIRVATEVAAILARSVKGSVSLIFFDTAPRYFDATGKSLDQIRAETKFVTANGGTSIGCAFRYAVEKGLPFGGIAIVSDGLENVAPFFAPLYSNWCEANGVEPPVYFYKAWHPTQRTLGRGLNLTGDLPFGQSCHHSGIEVQTFDLGKTVDYYSLPNLIQTMRTSRYSLVDEILATPLLTLDEVFAEVA